MDNQRAGTIATEAARQSFKPHALPTPQQWFKPAEGEPTEGEPMQQNEGDIRATFERVASKWNAANKAEGR